LYKRIVIALRTNPGRKRGRISPVIPVKVLKALPWLAKISLTVLPVGERITGANTAIPL
jgi:hypothetical protein